MPKKFAFIFGTRPEIIKMSPLIKEATQQGLDFFIIHTGQHYSELLDKVFWDNFNLPEPKYKLGIGSGTHAEQVGKMMIGIEEVLMKERPDYVTAYADPNSALASALAAAKLGIPIIQLEAGLRSFDRSMPEEINRLIVDRLAAYHFAPTPLQVEHLKKEGIAGKVFVFGNLIADVVPTMLPVALAKSDIHKKLGLEPEKYFVATVHRAGAVDNKDVFARLLEGLGRVAETYHLPVIYPMHPHAKKNLEIFGLSVPAGVRIIPPADYINFLALSAKAKLILSDSGGIQEEAAMLRVPLVTLRDNTERQETISLGSNIIVGFEPQKIVQAVGTMLTRPKNWQHPYGQNVAKQIINIFKTELL